MSHTLSYHIYEILTFCRKKDYNTLMDENLNLTENTEIEKALKEFEIKSQAEQVQKTPETSKTSDVPKMVQLVMKWSGGAIKEQKTAEYFLLGFVVLVIGISLYLFFSVASPNKISPTQKATLDQMFQQYPNLIKK
jgi:hypothetical protein